MKIKGFLNVLMAVCLIVSLNSIMAQPNENTTESSEEVPSLKKEKPVKESKAVLAATTTTSDNASPEEKPSKAPKEKKAKPAKVASDTTSASKPVKATKEAKPAKAAKEAKPAKSADNTAKTTTPREFAVDKVSDTELAKLKFGKKRKIGTAMMVKGYYFDAVDYYQSALSDKPKKWKMIYSLALANLKARNYINAENWYSKLSQTKKGLKKFPQAKYEQGIALKSMAQYQAAMDTLKSFMSKQYKNEMVEGMKKLARREVQGIMMTDTLATQTPKYKISTLGAGINTPFNDYAPFAPDLFNLSYTSQRGTDQYNLRQTGSNKVSNKFYESKKFGGDWESASLMTTDINTIPGSPSDFYPAADGKSMYYVQTLEDATGKVLSKIFVSENNGSGWNVGRPLNDNVNDPASNSRNPMIYTNGEGKEVLYFSSNRGTGKGGYDIYFAVKGESGEFGRARNAGGGINTPGDEVTPYFDAENSTLYFSSNGQYNIGGLDVFKSVQSSDGTEWAETENLGMVVNSSADDYYYRPGKGFEAGYFVSNRKGGNAVKCETCTDDIYTVRVVRGNVKVLGTVAEDINGIKNPAQDGVVEVFRTSDNTKLDQSSISNGRFSVDIDKENESIYLISRKKDFEDAKVTLNIGEYKPESIITEMVLKRTFTYVGTNIGTVFFDFNEFRLRPESPDTLNKVVAFMKQFPQYVVEVGGHTDELGTDKINDTIGYKRAFAVNRYLLSKEIPAANLNVISYGKHKPVAPNKKENGKDNPEGRALNRRVEFIVTGENK